MSETSPSAPAAATTAKGDGLTSGTERKEARAEEHVDPKASRSSSSKSISSMRPHNIKRHSEGGKVSAYMSSDRDSVGLAWAVASCSIRRRSQSSRVWCLMLLAHAEASSLVGEGVSLACRRK